MLYKPQKTIFFFTLFCCIGLRIFLKLFAVDPATGFYQGGALVPTVFNWILGIGSIGLLLLGWTAKNKRGHITLNGNLTMRIFLVLTGISALAFAGSSLLSQVDSLLTINAYASGPALVSSLFLSVAGIFCLIIAPVITGFLFIAVGIKGMNCSSRFHGVLFLFPVFWQTGMLLTTFMSYTLMRSVSDQLLSIVALLFIIPFLLANGRILSGTDTEKGILQLSMFGFSYSLVSIPLSLGILIASFTGKTVQAGPSVFAAVFYLCMGVYAASMMFSLKND